jgi:putative membrane protein
MLQTIANIVIAIVALLHVYFLVLEMFLWDTAYGRRIFVWVQAVPAAIALGLVLAS